MSPRPSGSAVAAVLLGLVAGVVGGWLAGLLRAPSPNDASPDETDGTSR